MKKQSLQSLAIVFLALIVTGVVLVETVSSSTIIAYNFALTLGTNGSNPGQFTQPMGMTLDSSGNVYVCDAGNDRIQILTSSGTPVLSWGFTGTGNGEFSTPSWIAIDSNGNLYVSDTANNRIQKFNSSGGFIKAWGYIGSENGQFAGPQGIAVDTSGNVYVADSGNGRIEKFTSSGIFQKAWGSTGKGLEQLWSPTGLAIDSSGYIYVADRNNHRIVKYDTSGALVTTWADAQLLFPEGIAVDSSGNVFVTCSQGVGVFSPDGSVSMRLNSYGTGDGQFWRAEGITVDPNDVLYVSDSSYSRVQAFTPTLAETSVPTSTPLSSPTPNSTSLISQGSDGFSSSTPFYTVTPTVTPTDYSPMKLNVILLLVVLFAVGSLLIVGPVFYVRKMKRELKSLPLNPMEDWQYFECPTSGMKPGTVFRVTAENKIEKVITLQPPKYKVEIEEEDEVLGEIDRTIRMKTFAGFTGFATNLLGNLNSTQTFSLDLPGLKKETTNDFNLIDLENKLIKERKFSKVFQEKDRYYIITKARKTKQITYILDNKQVSNFGGDAKIEELTLKGKNLYYTKENRAINQSLDGYMRIAFYAKRLKLKKDKSGKVVRET